MLTLVAVAALMAQLHRVERLQPVDLLNLRVYALVTVIFYLVGQWLTLLFRVVPEEQYLRKNKQQTGYGAPYLFAVMMRQATLWNFNPKRGILGVMISVVRHAWFISNLYYYCKHINGFGSEFILSIVITVLSGGSLPLLSRVLLLFNQLVLLVARGITTLLRSISQVLLEAVIYTIVATLAILSFYAFVFELDFLTIFDFKAKKMWWAFPIPLLLNRYVVGAGYRWLTMASFQNIALALTAFFRRNIVLDLLITAVSLPQLLVAGCVVLLQYAVHHNIGINHEMKLEVCTMLNLVLTPMHISMYMLMGVLQL